MANNIDSCADILSSLYVYVTDLVNKATIT